MNPGRNRLFTAARGSLLTAAACALLLFPLVAVRVDAVERTVAWRWKSLGWTAAAVFAISLAWRIRQRVAANRTAPPRSRELVTEIPLNPPLPKGDGSVFGTSPPLPKGDGSCFGTSPLLPERDIRVFGTSPPLPERDGSCFGTSPPLPKGEEGGFDEPRSAGAIRSFTGKPAVRLGFGVSAVAFALVLPFASSTYQVNVLTSALIAVILGLGLNIIVGLAGMLNLGYAAFTAVGAYGYALLNLHFQMGFWAALPAAGLIAAGFGLALGFPVLRLRGDYLAIVTLGFGEIARLVLENWTAATNGPSGIANVPRPGLFGMELGLRGATLYLYFIAFALAAAAAMSVARLKDSRIGRAWVALREDETAAETMGIDRTRTKLAALALGAFFAGVAGVLFAARTTFVNPASFTFLESAMVLATVVLGGPGSVGGVTAAALVLVLLPEYLRPFAQYRMLVFGAALVLMMVLQARRAPGRGSGRPAP